MERIESHLLSINAGSSSLKFALYKMKDSLTRVLGGEIENIGCSKTHFSMRGLTPAQTFSYAVSAPHHQVALSMMIESIQERVKDVRFSAVGHRVVNGGPNYSKPEKITEEIMRELHRISSFDPEHLPEEIKLIEIFLRCYPEVPQYACFDTAFHHEMPRIAQLLPIPRHYEHQGVRRYGFHGLSYEFLMEELTQVAGAKESQGRVILAHLGNGASLAAVRQGKSIDTSMSFTSTAGIPMGTRSGDLDPGLFWYLARTENMGAKQWSDLVNFKSGLLGISETSSDVRELLAIEKQDVRAAEAIELFCYQIKKWIGAFTVALGGLDSLVFSGGIGENSSIIRAKICEDLACLNIEIDSAKNQSNDRLISTASSRVSVRVMRTDEEQVIAKTVYKIVSGLKKEKKS